ncbi:MAG: RNase adapter RapZ [Candidatus Korobacteraceae bacterium]
MTGLKKKSIRPPKTRDQHELVIVSGMSGAGKASALKTFEDLGYYCVDNLPVGLISNFAELVLDSLEIQRAALVVDIREGARLDKLPQVLASLRRMLKTTVVFLEADADVLIRRYSETRRPHPLGRDVSVRSSLTAERRRLQPLRALADVVVDTTRFNVHELRAQLTERFQGGNSDRNLLISCVSFGYREGVPEDADLVFDVRFLPNPHFIPKFRPLTGRHPEVARYIRSFPQTREFINRISELLIYLIPHYIREGKSYLTIAFGCTGGKHRSVLIAEEVKKRLSKTGYNIKVVHRDAERS